MKKEINGQISLDLLFSLIIVMLFITGMFSFINIYKESKEDINLKNILEIKSLNIANTISTAKAFEDTNFEIKQKIEFINYKNDLIIPNINFDSNSVNITYEEISAKAYFSKNDFNIFLENNYLVIKR